MLMIQWLHLILVSNILIISLLLNYRVCVGIMHKLHNICIGFEVYIEEYNVHGRLRVRYYFLILHIPVSKLVY